MIIEVVIVVFIDVVFLFVSQILNQLSHRSNFLTLEAAKRQWSKFANSWFI